MDVPEILKLTRVCRRAWALRERLLRDLLLRQHQISLDGEKGFAKDPKATLSLVNFVKGGRIDCQKTTWTSTGESFLSK